MDRRVWNDIKELNRALRRTSDSSLGTGKLNHNERRVEQLLRRLFPANKNSVISHITKDEQLDIINNYPNVSNYLLINDGAGELSEPINDSNQRREKIKTELNELINNHNEERVEIIRTFIEAVMNGCYDSNISELKVTFRDTFDKKEKNYIIEQVFVMSIDKWNSFDFAIDCFGFHPFENEVGIASLNRVITHFLASRKAAITRARKEEGCYCNETITQEERAFISYNLTKSICSYESAKEKYKDILSRDNIIDILALKPTMLEFSNFLNYLYSNYCSRPEEMEQILEEVTKRNRDISKVFARCSVEQGIFPIRPAQTSEELQIFYVKQNPMYILQIKNPSTDICDTALENCPNLCGRIEIIPSMEWLINVIRNQPRFIELAYKHAIYNRYIYDIAMESLKKQGSNNEFYEETLNGCKYYLFKIEEQERINSEIAFVKTYKLPGQIEMKNNKD